MKNRNFDVYCSISPCGLSSEEQWVGFKGHGAVCRGRGFGHDQTDQYIQAAVARQSITAAEQTSGEAQQAWEEELGVREGDKRWCQGDIKRKKQNTEILENTELFTLLTTYLFKLFHGEHLLSELQYQILPHCAAKHLEKKTEQHM